MQKKSKNSCVCAKKAVHLQAESCTRIKNVHVSRAKTYIKK